MPKKMMLREILEELVKSVNEEAHKLDGMSIPNVKSINQTLSDIQALRISELPKKMSEPDMKGFLDSLRIDKVAQRAAAAIWNKCLAQAKERIKNEDL